MKNKDPKDIKEKEKRKAQKSTQDTNRIMGIAAIFISVLSMFAVIYQSYLAREENELMRIQQSATVLPYLDYWYSNVGREYKFVIQNKGVGPAFIKEVHFLGYDPESKDSVSFDNSNALCDFILKQSSFLDSISVVRSQVQANMLLSENESRNVYIFSFESQEQKRRFEKEFYLYFVGLRITYEDVYGTAWEFDAEKGYPSKLEKD